MDKGSEGLENFQFSSKKITGGCNLYIFIRSIYLQNLTFNGSVQCIFHLNLVGIPFILILFDKNRGGRSGGRFT